MANYIVIRDRYINEVRFPRDGLNFVAGYILHETDTQVEANSKMKICCTPTSKCDVSLY